ncbi:MAG: hypothetical protein WC827_01415 [Candidatus Paceibacterota bacterium]|jgi:hypothetical protein
MDNGLNNKTMIYWIVGVVVVIALFLGFMYWGDNSEVANNLENNATTTEDINDEDGIIRPTSTTTIKTPVKNTIPLNNFDYKG